MPTPKKGPRIGRDPAHQRLILANMASSLFEAGYLVTTVNRAKMLRPYAEHLITKAKKGGVHQRRQVIATIHDQDVTHKLFAEIGPRYRDRPGGYLRILKLGPRPGDNAPMAHACRIGVTSELPFRGGRPCAPAHGRVRRHRLPRLRRATRHAHGRSGAARRAGARAARRRALAVVRRSHRCRRPRVGSGGELRGRGRRRRRSGAHRPRGDPAARARGGRARRGVRRRRLRRPSLRALACLPLHDRQPTDARPVPRPHRVVGAGAARPRAAAPRRRPVPRRARLRLVLPQGPGRIDDHATRARVAAGTTSATACCATTSPRPRSAGRWCGRSSARSSTSAKGRSAPATSSGILRARDRNAAGRVGVPQGLCLWEVGY